MPGNEYSWDEYDIELLINSDEKYSFIVNRLLYARLSLYRVLCANERDIRGDDPFGYRSECPEQVRRLQVKFPDLFPGAFEGKLPPIQVKQEGFGMRLVSRMSKSKKPC